MCVSAVSQILDSLEDVQCLTNTTTDDHFLADVFEDSQLHALLNVSALSFLAFIIASVTSCPAILVFLGPETIKKFGAWIGAQLMISCSKIRKLRSGDYKQI